MKSLTIKITDPQIIQAFEDIATARNLREQKESRAYRAHWTAKSVAETWLWRISTGVTKLEGEEYTTEMMRRLPTWDWEGVDKLRAERKSNDA